MSVNDGAWRDGVAARRDPATNELGLFPWQKWDTGSHSSKVYSLSPSHPELLTNGFQIQLKVWGVDVWRGRGWEWPWRLLWRRFWWQCQVVLDGRWSSLSVVAAFFFILFFFVFFESPQLFTSGTQWFWCDLLFSEPLKHLGSCWVWLNYNRRRENNAANQTEYI